jgi:penicillin amidase
VAQSKIAPWQPEDSIAILKLLAVQMSTHLESEVLRARLSLLLNDTQLRDLLPYDPSAGIINTLNYSALIPEIDKGVILAEASSNKFGSLSPFSAKNLGGASNAWAASSALTALDGPLLANDPHTSFTAPALWYLARLSLQSHDVIGATIPGMPVVLLGRNTKLGWGMTSSYLDDQDLLVEMQNPKDPNFYRTSDGWAQYVTRPSIIKIKDHSPVTIILKWSKNGPILPLDQFNLNHITPNNYDIALSWTGLSSNDTSMTALMRLMTSTSVFQGIEAGRKFVAPSQNVTLVDKYNIALATFGTTPNRSVDHQTQGRMPALGYLERNQWHGAQPFSKNFKEINPPSGILGNTNNKLPTGDFPDHMSFDWGDTQRIQRWLSLMKMREVHTRESFIGAQLDTVSPTARSLLPAIGAELWFSDGSAPKGTPAARRARALSMMVAWNGEMNEHLPEPLIYSAWMRALQDRVIRDEVGPLADSFTHIDPVFLSRVFRGTEGAGVWCDIVQTIQLETCPEIAQQALDVALQSLSETYGSVIESWRWGDAHQATQDHPVLGDVGLLRYLVNIRQSTSGGDNTLMRGLTRGTGSKPYENVHGAAYRGIYDFADPDSSVFILSTGQSGHPLSRHYDDLGILWRRGEYVPMSLDRNLARAAAVGISSLKPLYP